VSLLLRVAALVLFILAALFFFGVGNVGVETIFGLQASGLACWVASTFPFPAMQA
jgi:hypothetical protein